MKTDEIFYDIVGNELHVGDIVAAPLWKDKIMVIGTISHLNYYSDRPRDGAILHRVTFPAIDKVTYALWLGSSMVKLPEQDRVMLRLRNFAPFMEE